MAESIVVGALLAKAAEVRGRIATLEGQMAVERGNLAHLQATLRMFDPAKEISRVRPVRKRAPRESHFAIGELTSRCRDALREATAPISAESVARKALVDKGLDPENGELRSDFIRRMLWSLHRLAKSGACVRLGTGLGVRWEPFASEGNGLAPAPPVAILGGTNQT